MFQFLHVMGITCNSDYICQMAFMLPTSLYLLRKFVNLNRDNFVKFAVCPKCASLYQLESCTRLVGGRPEGRGFNSHPGQSFSLSLCGPISISRANAHMVHMELKSSTSHYTLFS